MGVVTEVEATVASLRRILRGFDEHSLLGPEVTAVLELFAEGERLCAAGKTLAAKRAEEINVWRLEGDRSPAHWLARKTGVRVGDAGATLDTARALDDLAATDDAFRSGELSMAQANEVASGASADPNVEGDLLHTARHGSLAGVRDKARRARAATATDDSGTYLGIHRRRYFRHWSEPDGAFRFDGRLTPDAGARLLAAVEARADDFFTAARREGRRDGHGAYMADGLVALSDGQGAPNATVHVAVDAAPLMRGHLEPGERCEIPGIGPIPVATARALMVDGHVKVLATDGLDIWTVAHQRRTINAKLRTALIARDPTCVVPGCDVRRGLEIDHLVPFAERGPTKLENLARVCHWHHHLKTHCGYSLSGGPGAWEWRAPART